MNPWIKDFLALCSMLMSIDPKIADDVPKPVFSMV